MRAYAIRSRANVRDGPAEVCSAVVVTATFVLVRLVKLRSPGWDGAIVAKAETFPDRLFGMRYLQAKGGVLLRTRSVHTLGLKRHIRALSTSPTGEVLAIRDLRPNRVAFFRGAQYIIELPAGHPVPKVGASVTFDE